MTLLDVQNLSVSFRNGEHLVSAVKGVSFQVDRGETLAIVGESGSGKSVSALSILRLLAPDTAVIGYDSFIEFEGRRLDTMNVEALRKIRGNDIGVIFQEPMISMNPLQSVRRQVGEPLKIHKGLKGQALDDAVVELLELVQLPDAMRIRKAYPHELSGGQRQRVMIAMALANRPKLLIADEPTTALDATIQVEILKLLKDLQAKLDMALLFITHDLPVVRALADRVVVMERGLIVEEGATAEVFGAPQHDYTKRLLAAEPKETRLPLPAQDASPILRAENLRVRYPMFKGIFKRVAGYVEAVDDVSFDLMPGETLGVLGESGSGKSTLGQALLGLVPTAEGTVIFEGQTTTGLKAKQWRPLRKHMQIVFQDPFGSLSPRMSIGEIVSEGLSVHYPDLDPEAVDLRVERALGQVQLDADFAQRYPHELSGGQRQRVSVARALILEPKFIVFDEPTSALDLSVQAELLEILRELQNQLGLSYLFITHDLRVVRAMAHRVVVMRHGKIVEMGKTAEVFDDPAHEYTRGLLDASFDLGAVMTGKNEPARPEIGTSVTL